MLNKSGYKNYKYTNYLFVIVYQLEKIADEFKYICQFLQKRKLEKVDKDIVTLLKQVYEYFDIFYQMYYKYDISKAEKLYLERKNIIKQIEKLLAKNDIRTTLQALMALQDRCNSLHTNAYDEAVTTPTEESVRRAMACSRSPALE